MPIYEFYCSDCHTVFNFLSQSVNTTKRPDCPRCGKRRLQRRVSLFAISKKRADSDEDADPPDVDESKLEKAMAALEREAEGMNEDDPRTMARFMRKLYDSAGMRFGSGMEEAMRRMEAGEDPEKIEEEMGDVLEDEDQLFAREELNLKGLRRKLRPPSVDETLYDM